jgi:hypothetical protein
MYRRALIWLCAILLLLSGCSAATQNMSQAIPQPLPDGTVLLLRKKHAFGAIILDRQREFPQQVDFTWYYRDDGGSILDPHEPNVLTGQGHSRGSGMPEIRFGSFAVGWSVAATGLGYVYYERLANDPPQPDELEIAVTSISDLNGVDANDPRWAYRAAPPAYYYTLGNTWYFD